MLFDEAIYGGLRSHSESMLAQVSEPGENCAGRAELQPIFAQLQQQFQQQIVTLNLEGLEGAIASLLASLHTEMGKQIRLLGMDLMFLQTARQPETRQQRLTQIGDRLRLLISYCDAAMSIGTKEEG